MDISNLRIIGTSHIAAQSLNEVKDSIINWKPDMIAVELDRRRFFALVSGKKENKSIFNIVLIRRIGLTGFIFSIIGEIAQKTLGKAVGVMPGSEMKAAIRLAKKNSIPVALIDQDIEITLKRFSKSLTWKDRWNFVVDIFQGLLGFGKKSLSFDLRTVPESELINVLIKEMKERYPNVYNVLVKERNEFMAARLARIMADNLDKRVLVIVGAGHKEDMLEIINKEMKDNAV